ncbi:Transcriptional regulator, TetR family OS=Castellaniella defragrans (strain DSM / CCUG 39792/ 65Phen) OX=1437824 GN=BN940_09336 PE=4 SV=1 [Castellaniella denitrificans]|uniref:TetR/AcrR family transcriptional regulator n=1 Tax=Castellaniella sp. TaxID=1955812 RepID=UPI002AFFBE03|nr:TetR/AcrR family transcriptional regulator [Castellaniella sp.]
MGRKKHIDREVLLDLAEDIVRTKGAASLTIEALARAAGITKGGVQYSFASKAALIEAIGARWLIRYEELLEHHGGSATTPVERVKAHVAATFEDENSADGKAASVMTMLMQTPEFLQGTREWYRDKLENVDTTTSEGRMARLAFLAAEGAFYLRFLKLMEIDDTQWAAIYQDINGQLLDR